MNIFKKKAIVVLAVCAMAVAAVPVCVFAGADSAEKIGHIDGLEELSYIEPVEWEIICELPTAPFEKWTGYVPGGVTGITRYIGEKYSLPDVPNEPVTRIVDVEKGEYGTTESASYTQYRLGDADMNGKVNSRDARLALRAAARLETLTDLQKVLADIDKDGKVIANDARAILRVAAKLDPAPEEVVRVPA